MARAADPELAERRRRQILDAALVCFRRRGFHQASMQEICAEAQMSAGALYRYFKSKTDIIVAIAQDEHAEAEHLFTEMECRGSALQAMFALCEAALIKAEDFGGALIADVLAEASRNPELARHLAEGERRFRPIILRALERAVASGELEPSMNVAAVARILEVYLDGFVLGSVIPGLRNRDEALSDLRLILTRLLAPVCVNAEGAPIVRNLLREEV